MTPQEEAQHLIVVRAMLTDSAPLACSLALPDCILVLGALDYLVATAPLHPHTMAGFEQIQTAIADAVFAVVGRHRAVAIKRTDPRITAPALSVRLAWLLVSGLQLVDREPRVSAGDRADLRRISAIFERALVALHPECQSLLLLGWDPAYDQPAGDRSGASLN